MVIKIHNLNCDIYFKNFLSYIITTGSGFAKLCHHVQQIRFKELTSGPELLVVLLSGVGSEYVGVDGMRLRFGSVFFHGDKELLFHRKAGSAIPVTNYRQ